MREHYTAPQLWQHPALTDVTGATADGSSDSDRNVKTNLSTVAGPDVLERLVEIPISSWNYKSDPASIRHIGPMAQDFRAAFAVGKDDKTIYNVDANGIAFAAIQGLYQALQDKDAQLAAQQPQIAALEARLAALENPNRD